MQNELKKILNEMDVRADRDSAEEKAIEIYRKGENALLYLIDLGLKLKTKELDHKTKTLLRSVILTVSIFHRKNKADFENFSRYDEVVDFLIELSFLGFKSAHALLIDLEFSEFEIYKRKLLDLPEVERHKHDKDISIHEAFEEIRMSRSYSGSKGFKKEYYALGHDDKNIYEIYRIGKKIFSLRTLRKKFKTR